MQTLLEEWISARAADTETSVSKEVVVFSSTLQSHSYVLLCSELLAFTPESVLSIYLVGIQFVNRFY